MRLRHVWCLVTAVLLCVGAFGGTAQAVDNKTDVIRGLGSDTTYGVMVALDALFNNTPSDGVEGCYVVTQDTAATSQKDISCNPATAGPPFSPENWDHDVAMSYYPVGSGNGKTQLQNQGNPGWARIDYARSSSGRGSMSSDFRFVAFARDAVSWVSWGDAAGSPAAAVTNLTVSQLRGIFRDCTINNWSDVGGTSATIMKWAIQSGSGTRSFVDGSTQLSGNSANCVETGFGGAAAHTIFEHDPTPIRTCETATPTPTCDTNGWKRSIWWMGFAAWTTSPIHPTFGKAMGSRLGSIEGVAPTAETIGKLPGEAGAFTWARYVFNVYKNVAPNAITPAALDYVGPTGWICKGTAGTPDNVVAGTDSDDRGGHIVNRFTGKNWAQLITETMTAQGMARIAYGPLNREGVAVSGNARCIVF